MASPGNIIVFLAILVVVSAWPMPAAEAAIGCWGAISCNACCNHHQGPWGFWRCYSGCRWQRGRASLGWWRWHPYPQPQHPAHGHKGGKGKKQHPGGHHGHRHEKGDHKKKLVRYRDGHCKCAKGQKPDYRDGHCKCPHRHRGKMQLSSSFGGYEHVMSVHGQGNVKFPIVPPEQPKMHQGDMERPSGYGRQEHGMSVHGEGNVKHPDHQCPPQTPENASRPRRFPEEHPDHRAYPPKMKQPDGQNGSGH